MRRSVVVTGATSGIGRITALELAAAGYDVIGTSRTALKAEALETSAVERGVWLRTVLLDVANAESTVKAFAEIADMTDGGPWAVVNNAGYAQPGAVEDVDDAAVRLQLETNLIGPARIARLVVPAMRARGEGRIVNVSSIVGRVTVPLVGWYAASKHGLEAISDALRMEVAPFGIKVVLVEPGTFGTAIWSGGRSLLPQPRHPLYAKIYARADAIVGAAERGPDPIWVARAIRFALASPRPFPRYVVGLDAVASVMLKRVVPTSVLDLVKRRTAGLHLPHGSTRP